MINLSEIQKSSVVKCQHMHEACAMYAHVFAHITRFIPILYIQLSSVYTENLSYVVIK